MHVRVESKGLRPERGDVVGVVITKCALGLVVALHRAPPFVIRDGSDRERAPFHFVISGQIRVESIGTDRIQKVHEDFGVLCMLRGAGPNSGCRHLPTRLRWEAPTRAAGVHRTSRRSPKLPCSDPDSTTGQTRSALAFREARPF